MKILVTGGNGFLGRPLAENLVRRNHEVHVLVRSVQSEKRIENARYVLGDLTSLGAPTGERFDVIVHLAACVPRRHHEDTWERMIQVNVVGSMELYEHFAADRIVYISTVETYATSNTIPITPDAPQWAPSYYGASKIAAERFTTAYCGRHGIPYSIVRLSSVYGPGETIDRAVPNFVKAAIKNEDLTILGDGTDLRDYLNINDAVRGLAVATEADATGVFNLGSGVGVSILETAKLIIDQAGSDSRIAFKPRRKSKYDLVLDVTGLEELGFAADVPFADGLAEEIAWFRTDGNLL